MQTLELLIQTNDKGEIHMQGDNGDLTYLGFMDLPEKVIKTLELPENTKVMGFKTSDGYHMCGLGTVGTTEEEARAFIDKIPDFTSYGRTDQEAYYNLQENINLFAASLQDPSKMN